MKSLCLLLCLGMVGCAGPHKPTAALPSQGCSDPIGCEIDPVTERHWDLCIQNVCFDRTDGKGHKQEFTELERKEVEKTLRCATGPKKERP